MTCKVNADTTNGLKLTSDTSGEIDLQTNGTTKVHMDSSGNVGIGTSSPASELAIQATGAGARFEVETTGSTGFRIYQDDSDGFTRLQTYDITGTTYGKGMSFWTAPTGGATAERIKIDSSGNITLPNGSLFSGQIVNINVAEIDNQSLGTSAGSYVTSTDGFNSYGTAHNFSYGFTASNLDNVAFAVHQVNHNNGGHFTNLNFEIGNRSTTGATVYALNRGSSVGVNIKVLCVEFS